MKYFLAILCSTFLFGNEMQAQTFKAWHKAAENSFAQKDYYSAMKYYEVALEIEEDRTDLLYKYAASARLFDAYRFADSAYTVVIKRDTLKEFPLSTYWLAVMEKRQGKYKDAKANFQKYLESNPGAEDEFYISAAEREIKDCNWAIKIIEEPDPDILIEQLDTTTINTPFTEFAAAEKDGALYYSSFSYTKPKDKEYPPKHYFKVWKTDNDGGSIEFANFNDIERHTAHAAFNSDFSKMYYTLCDYGEFTTEIKCELYYRVIDENGNFSEPVKLPEFINMPGFTASEPNIGIDTETGNEMLYFVSDRPEGKGKLDIWASMIDKDGLFNEPVNLEKVNTNLNDVTPFFHAPSYTLYFSSEGIQGLGGYDIFKIQKIKDEWQEVEHMGYPLNSSYHDTHYYLNEGSTNGYFSSNRVGSKFLEPESEACCNDLYGFSIEVVDLEAFTFNFKDQQMLNGVTVKLFEITDDGEVFIASNTNPDGNDFNFTLKKNRKYALLANKEGFLPLREEIDLTDPKLTKSRKLKRDLYLVPTTVDLLVSTYNARSNRPLRGAGVRLVYEGQEIDFIENKRSNKFPFVLERGKKYLVIGSKVAFNPDTVEIDLTNLSPKILSLEKDLFLRSKEVNEFPPLLLYFDNDSPDPRRRKPTTDLTYNETYDAYFVKKDLFKAEYTKALEGQDSFATANRMEAFFEREIRYGYESLVIFTENLLGALNEGYKVELLIQGYTSPRAESNYNEMLSKRRANCLKNHFLKYQNGILESYLEKDLLTLTEVGYGEQHAPQNISDRLDDERESVYSVAASAERKVAIVGVKVKATN